MKLSGKHLILTNKFGTIGKHFGSADMMELADMLDLGSSASRRAGSTPVIRTKKKRQFSAEDCRFFLFFSLLSFHFSLFSKIVVSREKIREKREEKR